MDKLKKEFQRLDYKSRLKFMDEHFKGAASFTDDEGSFSVRPSTREETRLYNEWRLELFEKVLRPGYEQKWNEPMTEYVQKLNVPMTKMDDQFFGYFFDLLRDRYTKKVQTLKKLTYPDTAIASFIYDQLEEYAPKLKEKRIREVYTKDLSEKIIDNFPAFMEAKALFNYVGFLEEQKRNFKPTTKKPPYHIPENVLKSLHNEFNGDLWKERTMKDFIELFSSDNVNQEGLEGTRRGYQSLIAYLFKEVCIYVGVSPVSLKLQVPMIKNIDYKGRNPGDLNMMKRIETFISSIKNDNKGQSKK